VVDSVIVFQELTDFAHLPVWWGDSKGQR